MNCTCIDHITLMESITWNEPCSQAYSNGLKTGFLVMAIVFFIMYVLSQINKIK